MANPSSPSRSFWPHAIIGWFVLVIAGIVSFSVFAMRQNMDLVRNDYYEEEIRHQQQIDRLRRTQPFHRDVSIAYDPVRQSITVALPAAHAPAATGNIHLYRPSDARLDRDIKISVNADGRQSFNARSLPPGLWKIRVQWRADGLEYFFDQSVIIAGT